MTGNRKAATAEAVRWIDKFLPGSPNATILKEQLDRLTDEQFDEYISKVETGEEILPLYASNLSKDKISMERNLQIAEELDFSFFQRIWFTDPQTGVTYLTPVPHMTIYMVYRRQQQLLIKKSSIPEDNLHVDEWTGQPAGPSKGSKLSYPELQVLYAQGADRSIEELIKFRGGDNKAYQMMSRSIIETGAASMDAIKVTPTNVKSTVTFSILLKAMHIDNTLLRS